MLLAKADSLVDKIVSCPCIKLSNSLRLLLDSEKTGLLSNFAQQLRRQNAIVPDIYFTLLDSTGITPTLVLNQNSKNQREGKQGPFQNLNIRCSRDCKLKVLLLTDHCAILQRLATCKYERRDNFHKQRPSIQN